jgi:hypothetical protein
VTGGRRGVANRFLVAGGTGNWNSTTNWAATSGGASGASFPVAGDVVAFDSLSGNAPMTVNVASACASLVMSGTYAGTLTYTSTLTLTSTYTSVAACTIAGTAGTLIFSTGTTATLTSGGKTLTCALTLTNNGTLTLGDNWTVNGLVTAGSGGVGLVLNGNQITCVGGYRWAGTSGSLTGTSKLVLTGGAWDYTGGSSGSTGLNVDLQGNVTVNGTVNWGAAGKTLKYVSGAITTTGSTLVMVSACVLDTAGVTWNNLTFSGAVTYTTSSTLAWSGTLACTNAPTFSGAGAISGTGAVTIAGTTNFSNTGGLTTTGTMTLPSASMTFAGTSGWMVGTLTNTAYTASRTVTLTFGNTYTVTAALGNVGTTSAIRQAIVSSVPGSKVAFTVNVGASLTLSNCDPTDVDSSAGALVTSVGGVITTSLNWTGAVIAGTVTAPTFGLRSSLFNGREEMMDIPLDEVVYFDGISSLATGAASDADSAPTFAVYEEATDTDVGVGGNMTKRTSLTGDYRGTFTCSAANGFELGKWYNVVGSATVSGVACKAVLMRFRIVAAEVVAGYPLADVAKLLGTAWLAPIVAGTPDVNVRQVGGVAQTGGDLFVAVSNIAVTGAALNTVASSATYTTGTSTGGYANTATLDGVFDSVAAVGNAIDVYYEFNVSGTTGAVGVGATWDGYLAGAANTMLVYAYNWGNSAWDQLGTVNGIAGAVVGSAEYDLTSAHTGTGGNAGKVRIRFAQTGLTAGTLKTDRILLGYVVQPLAAASAPANFSALGITAGGHVSNVDTLTTYTGNTPQTGDAYAVVNSGTFGNAAIKGYVDDIGVAGAGLTALGDARLANLDATVSSRLATSGYSAPPSAASVASTVWRDLIGGGDFAVASSIGNVLAENINDTITSRSTYGGEDTPGTTTLLGRLTTGRATNLDKLDALVSSRLATAGYTTPPTTGAISTQVASDLATAHGAGSWLTATGFAVPGDEMNLTPAEGTALVTALASAVTSDHGAGSYVRNTEPVDVSANVAAIKAKTDNLPASPAAVGSQMTLADGAITEAKITVPAEAAGRPTGLLAMVRRAFEWVANKRTRDRSTGAVLLHNAADDGTLETQTQSTSGTVDTQTKGA